MIAQVAAVNQFDGAVALRLPVSARNMEQGLSICPPLRSIAAAASGAAKAQLATATSLSHFRPRASNVRRRRGFPPFEFLDQGPQDRAVTDSSSML